MSKMTLSNICQERKHNSNQKRTSDTSKSTTSTILPPLFPHYPSYNANPDNYPLNAISLNDEVDYPDEVYWKTNCFFLRPTFRNESFFTFSLSSHGYFLHTSLFKIETQLETTSNPLLFNQQSKSVF